MPLPSKRVKISFSLPKDLSYDFREQGDAVFFRRHPVLVCPPRNVFELSDRSTVKVFLSTPISPPLITDAICQLG